MSEDYHSTQKPVMRSEISRYAYGGFGVNIVSSLFASIAVYFMTDVAGLNVAVAGIVSGVALFFDAVTDVLLGAICDKTATKMGRYRPYILCGSLILALGALISFTTVPFGPLSMTSRPVNWTSRSAADTTISDILSYNPQREQGRSRSNSRERPFSVNHVFN